MTIIKSNFPSSQWPGIKKAFEDMLDPNSEWNKRRRQFEKDAEKWEAEKQRQLAAHNGTEGRMVIGHGESIAVIDCAEGQLYFQGIPREFL